MAKRSAIMHVRFVVTGEGAVSSAHSEGTDAVLGECIETAMRISQFPTTGATSTFAIPVQLAAEGPTPLRQARSPFDHVADERVLSGVDLVSCPAPDHGARQPLRHPRCENIDRDLRTTCERCIAHGRHENASANASKAARTRAAAFRPGAQTA